MDNELIEFFEAMETRLTVNFKNEMKAIDTGLREDLKET